MHWASRYPHNKRKEQFVNESHKSQDSDYEDSSCDEECEDVEIVLLTDEVDEFQIFVTESAKSAVVDTACSRTVAGEIWFNNYLSELNESLMDKVSVPVCVPAFLSESLLNRRGIFSFTIST